MKKPGPNAKWIALSPEQRQTLEGWLSDDGLSYEQALERARKELGFTGAASSLRRFYQRMAQERTLADLAESAKLSSAIGRREGTIDDMRESGMKLVAQWFLRKVAESPDQVKEWAPAAKLLLARDANELKDAENDIRRGWLEYTSEKASYDNVAWGVKHLKVLQFAAEARKSPKFRHFEQNLRTNDMRKRLFGENLPELLPENEAQEKAMQAAGTLPPGYEPYAKEDDDETKTGE